jgi:hypothetical protein
MTLEALRKPIDSATEREFDWSELVWHIGLDPESRHALHDHLQHVMIVWLFCRGWWDVLPLETTERTSMPAPTKPDDVDESDDDVGDLVPDGAECSGGGVTVRVLDAQHAFPEWARECSSCGHPQMMHEHGTQAAPCIGVVKAPGDDRFCGCRAFHP